MSLEEEKTTDSLDINSIKDSIKENRVPCNIWAYIKDLEERIKVLEDGIIGKME